MRFVLTRRFYVLLALGIVPLLFAWGSSWLAYAVLAYDILLVAGAAGDYLFSRNLPEELTIERSFSGRFAIGDPTEVTITIKNASARSYLMRVKDQYPAALVLSGEREFEALVRAGTNASSSYELTPPRRGRYEFGTTAVRVYSRLGLVWVQGELGSEDEIKVYPNMRRAREMELKALGANA
ncbi:MAG: hypothetical protein OEM82_12095, partial [Acidobacteriota bacterium]|nr:hypothetical protein [Acidobacteriota bacterium]